MPFVDQRWLGGMLTNFKTVKASLKKLKDMQAQVEAGLESMNKLKGLLFQRELAKLEKDIGGIQDMAALPDALFVIDVGFHKIAIAEAKAGHPWSSAWSTPTTTRTASTMSSPATTTRPRPWRCMRRVMADAVPKARTTPSTTVVERPPLKADEFVEVSDAA